MRVILGVGGGIAAYKAAELARHLIQSGAHVQCVLTAAASEFIQPLTFATLTGQKVITGLFSTTTPEGVLSSAVEHIRVAREHDILLVAPATANLLAKFAHGLADDFLSTLYLAFSGPVVLAPAMNDVMWSHPATQENLDRLRARGHQIVEPGAGFLACGSIGPGRLAEPAEIATAVFDAFGRVHDLQGETVLVAAGPTREPIDPVRYLTNRSSGRMGYALAEAAAARGAKVVLVSGPVAISAPAGLRPIFVSTAEEMHTAVLEQLTFATVVVQCAAVSDYRPVSSADHKIKKSTENLNLLLERTPDILAELGKLKGARTLIGFAAETEQLEEEATRKLKLKNCDMIVANRVGLPGTGFDSAENEVTLILRGGETVHLPRAPKRVIADQILDRVRSLSLAAIAQ